MVKVTKISPQNAVAVLTHAIHPGFNWIDKL